MIARVVLCHSKMHERGVSTYRGSFSCNRYSLEILAVGKVRAERAKFQHGDIHTASIEAYVHFLHLADSCRIQR